MGDPLRIALPSRRATRRLGKALAEVLKAGDLVVLEGDLGAGKTFLVRALARAKGVPQGVPVTSPTFALVHELPSADGLPIVHADLYRLEAAEALDELGLVERIGGDALVLVEWGARFGEQLGGAGMWVHMCLLSDGTREARVEGRGPRGISRQHALAQACRALGLNAEA